MASPPLPGVNLDDKTVKGLMEDCLSIFPDCTKLGHDQIKVFLENMMVDFRLWAERTEESAAASGSVDKVLESRPNALYKIKFALFTILNRLNWYKTNASQDEQTNSSKDEDTARCLKLIKILIDGLDTVCSAIVR